jgi:magnesium transporter
LEYSEEKNLFLDEIALAKRGELLSHFEAPDLVEYLEQIEPSEEQVLLESIEEKTKSEVSLLRSFEETQIGSRMSTNFISVLVDSSVQTAMRTLVTEAAENDNVGTVYVVNQNEVFLGAIDLKDLIVARKNDLLSNITKTSYPFVFAEEEIEDCIEQIKDYSEDSIPVLDSAHRLLGVLTSQDITELSEERMSEEYARLAGLSAEEDLDEPVLKSMGKRLPWLVVLLGLALLVSAVVGTFEHVVEHLTLIVSFQSLVLGMSGNAGTQALGVTIRVLADENLARKEKISLVAKEARVALLNGFVLGLLSFLFIGVYLSVAKGETPSLSFSVSACTGFALVCSVFLSGVTGTVVPILFKKIKIDPAVASGPMITTVSDLVAVVTYYGFSWWLLIYVFGF